MQRKVAFLLCAVSLGCSPKQYVMRQAADALTGTSDSTLFTGDDDPELVRDSLPVALKGMEALVQSQPDHVGLHASLASGFTTYGYAFVQQEADMAEAKSLATAQQGWDRAKKLFRRAHRYAMAGLELKHPGFGKAFKADAAKAVQQLNGSDVELAYWAGSSLAAEIVLSKDKPDLLAELPAVGALMHRCLALDEDWGGGAVHSFMVSYESRSPSMGGSAERARKHFERTLELTGGKKAGPYLSWAEQQCVALQDMACFNTMLDKALAIKVDDHPQFRLENVIYQRRALWLRARASDLIDVPDVSEEASP
jgi:predicted anti-sigma-YlaC factor YlaD